MRSPGSSVVTLMFSCGMVLQEKTNATYSR